MKHTNYSKDSIDWVSKLPKDSPPIGQAATRYDDGGGSRGTFLDAAYSNAKLTLPSLIREGDSNDTNLFPWQGVGADGVSFLASRFHTALFPTGGTPFFTIRPDKIQLDLIANSFEQIAEGAGDKFRNQFEALAAATESKLMFIFDRLSIRSNMHKAFEHLIVTGNVLLYIGEDESFLYPLDKYVLRRTAGGKPLEIVIREKYHLDSLPEKFCKEHYFDNNDTYEESFDRQIDVFTRVYYDYKADMVWWWQEAWNKLIPDSMSSAPINGSPWIPLRFDKQDNTPYAEGLVSRLFGSLFRLDGMQEASAVGYAASLRHIFLISPAAASMTPQMLRDARRMEAFVGNPEDISVVQGGKTQDLTAASNYEQNLTRELQQRFAMPLSIQRKGERVTSAEIEYMATQLEAVSAGFYSLFSDEAQVPLVTRLLHIGKKDGLSSFDNIKEFQDENGEPFVKIRPLTGLAALARNDDLQRLMKLVQVLQSFMSAEQIENYVNMPEMVQQLTTALGVNTSGLIYTTEQIQQREAAAAQAAQQQQDQAAAMQQQQQDMQLGQAAMNSTVLTELVKKGQVSAQDLEALTAATAPSDTAAAIRPGLF